MFKGFELIGGGNPFAPCSPSQLNEECTGDPRCVTILPIDCLRVPKQKPDDRKALAVLIYHGQMYVFGA